MKLFHLLFLVMMSTVYAVDPSSRAKFQSENHVQQESKNKL